MKNWISFELAIRLSLIIFAITALLHLLAIIAIGGFDLTLPDFLWGGMMKTREQLLVFEIISLSVASLCIIIMLIVSGRIRAPRLQKAARILVWVLFVLFLLNTFGNLMAVTYLEKSFALLTLLLSLLMLRLARGREGQQTPHQSEC